MIHVPVMVEEVLADMRLRPGAVVVDGTLGHGGHSLRILEAISPGGILIGFDWDRGMLDVAEARLSSFQADATIHFENANFRMIAPVLSERALSANAILLDLGLNSAQLEDPDRGMAFKHDGPLDLRMDRSSGEPASAVVNRMSPDELERIIFEFSDDRWARAIARKIVERRRIAPLKTTNDLVEAVLAAIPAGAREKRIHPATRTFQALRIYVNGELDGLDDALRDAASVLAPQGRLVVMSYHSGEDRIVKNTFRELAQDYYTDVHRKPLVPTEAEISKNPRSRSAKLRTLEREI